MLLNFLRKKDEPLHPPVVRSLSKKWFLIFLISFLVSFVLFFFVGYKKSKGDIDEQIAFTKTIEAKLDSLNKFSSPGTNTTSSKDSNNSQVDKDPDSLSSSGDERKPDLFLIFLESFAVTALGVVGGWFVNFFFVRHNSEHEIALKKDNNIKGSFVDFFGSRYTTGNEEEDVVNTAIILPSYNAEANHLLEEDNVKKEVEVAIKKSDDPLGSRESIKNFRESAAISFAQSDMIASTDIIAAYAKKGMVLPTIRTDVQGIIKFLQHKQNLADPAIFESILAQTIDIIGEEELKKIGGREKLKERMQAASSKVYDTMFLIGMYSNIFLMDFFNDTSDGKLRDLLHFVIYNSIENDEVMRSIYIRSNLEKMDSRRSRLVPLSEKKAEVDYALVARFDYKDRNFFVAAGITAFGTECATEYLMNNWQKLHKYAKKDSFAILIEVPRTQEARKTVSKFKLFDAYPSRLMEQMSSNDPVE
jgi:hypothetical protein